MPEYLPYLLKLGFFGLAIALLVLVTLGVGYLTFVEMQNRRLREQASKDSLISQSKPASNVQAAKAEIKKSAKSKYRKQKT